jgi:hypothetical protein
MTEHTLAIKAWRHHTIQNDAVDTVGLPFHPDLFTESIPGVVTERMARSIGSIILAGTHPIPISQLSERHARSYEVGNDTLHPLATWSDRHGNAYTSLSLKGNNFSNMDIIPSLTAPSGYIPYGLQEDDALLRIIRASNFLREKGIDTEWIVGVYEPQYIPDEKSHSLLRQDEYKQKLVQFALSKYTVEDAAKIAKAVSSMNFFVTARAMAINHRPTDFMEDMTKEAFLTRLEKIFTVFNTISADDEHPLMSPLDIKNTEDIRRYLSIILPGLRGRNIALLHNEGLVHKFPVLGNTTALGGIIDLDSIHGEPLGFDDQKITQNDIFHDLIVAHDSTCSGNYSTLLVHLYSGINAIEEKEYRHANINESHIFGANYLTNREISRESIEALQVWIAIMAGKLWHESSSPNHFENTAKEIYQLINILIPEDKKEVWISKLAEPAFNQLSNRYASMSEDEIIINATSLLKELSEENSVRKSNMNIKHENIEQLARNVVLLLSTRLLFSDDRLYRSIFTMKLYSDAKTKHPEVVNEMRDFLSQAKDGIPRKMTQAFVRSMSTHVFNEICQRILNSDEGNRVSNICKRIVNDNPEY